MIAALFVQRGGVYYDLPDVDPWDEERDARLYPGPWPIVAHPPCARWGRYWNRGGHELGADDGCFAAALEALKRWGGVLEHPEGSAAWRHFDLATPPRSGGWINADFYGELWTCCVEQGAYGFRSSKKTWLLCSQVEPKILQWGKVLRHDLTPGRARRTGILQKLSRRQRSATPLEFRDVLLSMARSVQQREGVQ